MLGRTLAQYCPNDSAMTKEQKRIEAELKEFEKHIWGDQEKKDSLDSIAATKEDVKKSKKTKTKTARASKAEKSVKQRPSRSSGSSAARVTVRRERH